MPHVKCSSENPSTCRYHGFSVQRIRLESSQQSAISSGDFDGYYDARKQLEALEEREEFASEATKRMDEAKTRRDFQLYSEMRDDLHALTGTVYAKNSEEAAASSAPVDVRVLKADENPAEVTTHYLGEEYVMRRADQWGEDEGIPSMIRVNVNEELTEYEAERVSQLVGYSYVSRVHGSKLSTPQNDTNHSVVFTVGDDNGSPHRLPEFEESVSEVVKEGSPVRKTDKAGEGTKGTRLVPGLDRELNCTVYYR